MEVSLSYDPATLIAACLAGDSLACSELFEQTKGLIYRTAYLIRGNPQDAEDALQDVFMRVLKSLHTYDPEKGAFTTWVYRITVNTCVTANESARRAAALPLDEDLPGQPEYDDPQAIVDVMEQAERLLGALTDDQRVVVVLRFYGDLSYKEIAEITGAELGTVQSRLARAIRKMRDTLNAVQEVH